MVSSSGIIEEYPSGFKGLSVMDKSKCSKECSSKVSSVSIDSLISTINNEKGYPVGTMCSSASEALSMLQDKNHKFDIILMAYPVNDMEEFKQIQQLAMETDLPIRYLLPKDTSSFDVKIMNDVLGEFFSKLSKPICLRSVQCLWFPVAKKREEYIRKLVKAELIDRWEGSMISKLLYSRWGDEEQREDHMDVKVKEEYASFYLNGKHNFPWMASKLHEQFVTAVYQLGTQKADAAKIFERMNSPVGLTRKQVAIHLEEFRFLRENFAREHPSKMPFNEVAETLCSRSRVFPGVRNLWRTYCGSYYA
ncbi:hypothetical protein MKW98_031150 [Papaver atlanticum]|uniref:Response regulatory domain-containing protein n=1 Tax=Papaver atlanticum TaxID=357466 RepID=A0AAD4SV56_9MAGN|nr:hypothetical protein MKW98_031150 [Papaver atlanticum]